MCTWLPLVWWSKPLLHVYTDVGLSQQVVLCLTLLRYLISMCRNCYTSLAVLVYWQCLSRGIVMPDLSLVATHSVTTHSVALWLSIHVHIYSSGVNPEHPSITSSSFPPPLSLLPWVGVTRSVLVERCAWSWWQASQQHQVVSVWWLHQQKDYRPR